MILKNPQAGETVDMRQVGFDTTRVEGMAPVSWRLARRTGGEIVLQGRFDWWGHDAEGDHINGHEWRDLPTVDLRTEPEA